MAQVFGPKRPAAARLAIQELAQAKMALTGWEADEDPKWLRYLAAKDERAHYWEHSDSSAGY